MSGITVSFEKRDFSGPVRVGDFRWTVERLEWRAVGGPWKGRLRASVEGAGSPGGGAQALPRLWSLVELLRCGVRISDQAPAWWGYVSAVEIHAPAPGIRATGSGGGVVARLELDSMWNRGMVEYYQYNPASFIGDQSTTAVQQVEGSVLNYGYKERVFRAPVQTTASAAEAYLLTMLSRCGYPVKILRLAEGASVPGYSVTMELRGWWETLDWRFYTDARGQVGHKSSGARVGLGWNASHTRIAASFTSGPDAWAISDVWVKAIRINSPVDNLKVDICQDSGGSPGGSIGSGQVSAVSIPYDVDWRKITLSVPAALSANATYWVVFSRTGAVDSSNHFHLTMDNLLGNTGSVTRVFNGSGWVANVPDCDLVFMLVGGVDNGSQLTRIFDPASGCGQFLAGSRIETVVGVSSIPYRFGSTRGREEAEMHLRTGTSTGARLLARVEPDRICRVFPQPDASSAALIVGDAGKIVRRDLGTLRLSEWPAGQWVKLGAMASAGTPGNDGAVFVEACSWLPADGFHILEG